MRDGPIERLRRFSKLVGSPLRIDRLWGISYHIELALSDPASPFRIVRIRRLKNMLTYDLEWKRKGKTLHQLSQDFFSLYGCFAHPEQYVGRNLDRLTVTYLVLAGNSRRNPYGFPIRIRVAGPAVRRVLAAVQALGRRKLTSPTQEALPKNAQE
jgi:hypothetical protein